MGEEASAFPPIAFLPPPCCGQAFRALPVLFVSLLFLGNVSSSVSALPPECFPYCPVPHHLQSVIALHVALTATLFWPVWFLLH